MGIVFLVEEWDIFSYLLSLAKRFKKRQKATSKTKMQKHVQHDKEGKEMKADRKCRLQHLGNDERLTSSRKKTSAMQEFLAYNPTRNNNLLTKVIMLLGVNVQSVVIIQINHLKTKTEKESNYFLRFKCNGEFLRNGFITFRECLVVFVHNQ